jgi:hypothetical protein
MESPGDQSIAGIRRETMKTLTAMVVCASVAMPLFAYAQSAADVAYCNKLSQSYRATNVANTPDAVVPTAMSKCASAPGEAIPVIEKALKDAKVTLPKRD